MDREPIFDAAVKFVVSNSKEKLNISAESISEMTIDDASFKTIFSDVIILTHSSASIHGWGKPERDRLKLKCLDFLQAHCEGKR